MHVPATVSRYVYVELIDPLDSVLMRVKLRPLDACYAGRIDLPEDLPESSYELCTYTNFMRSIGEDYLYTRSILIGHPQSRSIVTDTKFEFESDKRVSAEFRFMRHDRTPLTPETITVRVNNGAPMTLKAEPDGRAGISFILPPDSKHRVLLLESIQNKYRYRQYVTVPFPDEEPDVTFYPKGGALLTGTVSKVTFKAMRNPFTSKQFCRWDTSSRLHSMPRNMTRPNRLNTKVPTCAPRSTGIRTCEPTVPVWPR